MSDFSETTPQPEILPDSLSNLFSARLESCIHNSYHPDQDSQTTQRLLSHTHQLSQQMAETTLDLSNKLSIDLAPPLDFDFGLFDPNTTAFIDDEHKITYNLAFMDRLSQLISNNKPEEANARLNAFLAHEMYHLSQEERFPTVTQKEKDQIKDNPSNMSLYDLTRIEQAARLYSAKYLDELPETNPSQQMANLKVAKEIRRDHSRRLLKARLRNTISKFFG